MQTKNTLTALTLAIGLALGATASLAAAPPHARATTATDAAATHDGTLGREQQQLQHADALAQRGRQAMSYIVAARQLLSDQHADEARQYLEKARGLLTELMSEITAEDNGGLLPIYSQLGLAEEVEITAPMQQKLRDIYPDVIRGQHEKVVEALKTVGIELQYRFVDMPVAATLGKVESALKSLSAEDSQQAGQALADAQQGLIHDSIIINAVDENPAG